MVRFPPLVVWTGFLLSIAAVYAGQKCDPTPINSTYKGRFFANQVINTSLSYMSTFAPSVYACHHLCSASAGCIALSFNDNAIPEARNCFCYNRTRIQFLMNETQGYSTIILLPLECGENSTIDGQWSPWSPNTTCSGAGCSEFRIKRTRTCTRPSPRCNGNFCRGSDIKTARCLYSPCTILDSSEMQQITQAGVYVLELPSGLAPVLVDVRENRTWIYLQKRNIRHVGFNRGWDNYKNGFGSFDEEFWLGNDVIHELTTQNQDGVTLYVEVDGTLGKKWTKYSNFKVASETDNYKLEFGEHLFQEGGNDAGDSLGPSNGMNFATKDVDNNPASSENCAVMRRGSWWYSEDCSGGNINGRNYLNKENEHDDAMFWQTYGPGQETLSETKMQIAYP